MKLAIYFGLAAAFFVATPSDAFVVPVAKLSATIQPLAMVVRPPTCWSDAARPNNGHDDDDENQGKKMDSPAQALSPFALAAVTSLTTWLGTTSAALADESPDWGLFAGRTGSLIHPLAMTTLLGFSLYTGLLGLNWRRLRTLGDEINAKKKQLPDLQGAGSVAEALKAAQDAGDSSARLQTLAAAQSIETDVAALQAERKTLSQQNLRERHFAQGALLAFCGTFSAIVGPLNTYARAGKLFPGPHLYVGATVVVLWSLAVATVPAMQKGSDLARSIHIGANTVTLALFGWQVLTGWQILLKVLENTSWP